MAVAMAFEMGFLGLTFAAACACQPKAKAIAAVVAGPIFLMLGSALGGLVANALAVNEPALVGCTAFGGKRFPCNARSGVAQAGRNPAVLKVARW